MSSANASSASRYARRALVVARVRDNGVGLPGGSPDRLFDPFVTSKPGGLGMGLSISRTIVQSHGGELWAEPNSDRGATFCFSVPVRRETDA